MTAFAFEAFELSVLITNTLTPVLVKVDRDWLSKPPDKSMANKILDDCLSLTLDAIFSLDRGDLQPAFRRFEVIFAAAC